MTGDQLRRRRQQAGVEALLAMLCLGRAPELYERGAIGPFIATLAVGVALLAIAVYLWLTTRAASTDLRDFGNR